eukprot:scaffold4278_cov263-Pinguiococcus_pyrenoidosus.AAC.3
MSPVCRCTILREQCTGFPVRGSMEEVVSSTSTITIADPGQWFASTKVSVSRLPSSCATVTGVSRGTGRSRLRCT